MIKQPQQMTFTDKKFSMIVYGSPGIGKTTLALSAPDPILIDFENGVDRVRADHRKLTIVCENYEEVLHDIESPEVRDCQKSPITLARQGELPGERPGTKSSSSRPLRTKPTGRSMEGRPFSS